MRSTHTELIVVGTFIAAMLGAAEAHTSGSYGNTFISASCKYSYQQTVRKMFADSDSSSRYYDRYDKEQKARFVDMQPKLERAVADARKSGAPIAASFDLFLPAVSLKSAKQVDKLGKALFPVNLRIDISSNDSAEEHLEITAAAPLSAAQVSALAAAAKQAAASARSDGESAVAFEKSPTAVTHVDALFALYIGTTSDVLATDRARVTALLQAQLDKILPSVRARFADPKAASAAVGVDELDVVKPHIDKHPQGLPGAFHPWGPLSSARLARVNVDMGSTVNAILMVSPPEKHDWGALWRPLDEWLTAACADAHRD